MSGLHIPDGINQFDTLTAALAYADAGWYVLPVRLDHPDRSKRKSPGSIVGAHWPSLSSRDPQQITAWWAGTSHGIALHCGRSGAVVLDVDHPQHTHDLVLTAMETSGCPHQSTRDDTPARGHYLFANTTGRRIGNSLGKLATTPAWGEVRGANGVIIAAPSVHPDGGHYRWERTGAIPPIPDYIDEALPDSTTPEDTASDTQVREFLDRHTQSDRPEALKGLVNTLTAKLAGGAACHMSTLGIVTDAMAEAAAGLYPAREAWEALRRVFLDTATTGTSTGRILTESEATGEYAGIVAWAVAQAPSNVDKARERIEERYPDNVTEVDAADITTGETIATKTTVKVTHFGHLGMAYKLGDQYRNKLLYVNGVGWHRWDGKRWAKDGNGAARRAVHTVIKREWIACAELRADERDKRAKQISRYESASSISGILTEAAALEVFSVTVNELDADPYLVNVANGTLDLHTLTLRPASPADRITKVCRGAYTPGGPATVWQEFLAKSLPEEPVRQFVQRLTGYALLGEVREHLLPIFTGEGANGKSTFYEGVLHTLGDYGIVAEPELFTHRDNAHPTGQMDLMGRRLAVVSETDENKSLAESTMKRLTGGDPIRARYMRENFVEFIPSHLPILVTNHLPKVSGDDPAIWRRIRVVPWNVVIAPQDQDKELARKLQLEADGILTWAVSGLRDYLDAGLAEPESVIRSTSQYRADSDAVARFIDEALHKTEQVKITASDLFEAWESWRRAEGGVPEISKKALGQALTRHGYESKQSNGKTWWFGLCVLKEDTPDGQSGGEQWT